jgi:hypothetical protein
MTGQGVLALWLCWYVALMSFQQIAWSRLRLERPDTSYNWTAALTAGEFDSPRTGAWFYARWDSPRYVRIAQTGYADPRLATFFPAYPLLMRLTDRLLLAPFWREDGRASRMAAAGLLVSGLCSALAALGMFRLAQICLGEAETAGRAVVYFLLFPTAMFMPQIYTESTYLALSLWGLVFAYRRQWALAGMLCAGAAFTRPTGLFLVFPLLTQWLDAWWRGHTPRLWTILAVSAPVAVFFGFNRYLALNGIDTFEAQQDFGRYLLQPYAALALAGQIAWLGAGGQGMIHIGLDLLATLFATWMSWRERWRFSGLALYGLAATWVSLATGQLVSQNRYILVVLPIFWGLARWGRCLVFDRAWTLVSVLLLALYLIQFTGGYWAG